MEFEISSYFCKTIVWNVGSIYTEWEMGYCNNAETLASLVVVIAGNI